MVPRREALKNDESQNGRELGGRPPVQSLARGLAILSQFGGGNSRLSLAELSRRTDLHRATVHRFVKTLEMEGYLIYDAASGLYSIGPAWAVTLFDLGSATVFAQLLNTDLRTLAESSRETATLGVRQGDNVHVVHVAPTSRGFIPKMADSSSPPELHVERPRPDHPGLLRRSNKAQGAGCGADSFHRTHVGEEGADTR